MPLRGHIHNGVVILDAPTSLPDGTPVSVEPLLPTLSPSGYPRGSAAAILETLRRFPKMSPEDQAEWDQLTLDVQRDRKESLALEIERDARRPPLD